MREIKFRGKRLDNGEWAIGYYVAHRTRVGSDKLRHLIICNEEMSQQHPVDPKTVGQYTSLKDKNGAEIYEGDIVKYTRFNWKEYDHPANRTDLIQICGVYWNIKDCAFNQQGNFDSGGGWSGLLHFEDSRADRNEIEVIGNIHENPELLNAAS